MHVLYLCGSLCGFLWGDLVQILAHLLDVIQDRICLWDGNNTTQTTQSTQTQLKNFDCIKATFVQCFEMHRCKIIRNLQHLSIDYWSYALAVWSIMYRIISECQIYASWDFKASSLNISTSPTTICSEMGKWFPDNTNLELLQFLLCQN